MFAHILFDKGVEDEARIEDFVSRAKKLNPNNFRVYEIEAALKKRKYNPSWTGGTIF
jgi:hypothetical protein